MGTVDSLPPFDSALKLVNFPKALLASTYYWVWDRGNYMK